MNAQETERVVREAYDAYNERDFARSQANAHPDVVTVMVPTGQQFRGHAGQVEYLQGWATAFPDRWSFAASARTRARWPRRWG